MVEEEQEFLDSEEDNIDLNALPAVLWHEGPLSSKPEDPPQEVDFVADDVEVQRLIKMGNLGQQPADQIKNVLTTKFVRDWRIKTYEEKEKDLKSRSGFAGQDSLVASLRSRKERGLIAVSEEKDR